MHLPSGQKTTQCFSKQMSQSFLKLVSKLFGRDHSGSNKGGIILPTQTMHYLYKGNPSKLPHICVV